MRTELDGFDSFTWIPGQKSLLVYLFPDKFVKFLIKSII